jgi:NAD(P) transhydrogenase subunit beta
LVTDRMMAMFKKKQAAANQKGANDVVNPAATHDRGSPIYGMPILNVHEARSVIIIKRSLGAGFAGIRNELFEYPNAVMMFADARKGLAGLTEELKQM